MTENKSFRIRNFNNETATIWPVGENHYQVNWEADENYEDASVTYAKSQVKHHLNCGSWKIIDEKSLPRTFKFKCCGYEDFTYTFTQGEGYSCEEYSVGPVEYSIEDAIKNIQDGHWIVLPSEDTTALPSGPENIKIEDVSKEEALKNWNTYFKVKPDIIQRIKSATQNYDMTISIDGGCYHIYDNLCDISYKADTDEKLIEVLDAIDFLCGCVDG